MSGQPRSWPVGDGEMARRIRAHGWAATPLGPVETWSERLKVVVELMLAHGSPMAALWGPERVKLYNDAYRAILGGKHPTTLGRPLHEERYVDEPLLQRVWAGETVSLENAHYTNARHGPLEDAWYDLTFSPLRDEVGRVAGALVTVFEATARLTAERALRASEARQAFLLKLSDALRPLADPTEIQATAMRMLAQHLGVTRSQYYEADPSGEFLDPAGGFTDAGPPVTERVRMDDFGTYVKESFRAGRTLAVADVSADPRVNEAELKAYDALGFRAFVGISLVKGGRLVGTLGLHHAAPRGWADGEIALAGETAERTWAAVERARAEAARRESEERYRVLFESIDEGFCTIEVLFDAQGKAHDYRFLQVNPAFERQTGLARAVGRTMRALVPEHEEHWFEIYGHIALTGEPARFENRADALGRWYDVYAFRIGRPGERRVAILFRDVSKRKRAEAALRESEARFRALVTAGSHMIYRMSPDWRRMHQLDGRGILADTAEPAEDWADAYILPEDRPAVLAAVADAVRGGSLFELEHRVRRADGGIGWVLSRAVPILGPEGEIVEWFGAGSDVTERRVAQERLRESKERFGLIVDSARDYAIFTVDPDAAVVDWHAGAEAVFGYAAGDIVGSDGRILFTPEDRESGEAERELRTAREEGSAPNVRWHLRRDGSRVFIEGRTVALRDSRGELRGYLKIGQDVTDRRAGEKRLRASEELFRSFAENSADVLWIVDADTAQLKYLSPAFEATWGEGRERVMGDLARWAELLHPDDRARAGQGMPRLLAGETYAQEYRIVRQGDGAVRWIQDTGFPIRDGDGRVTRVAGIAQDTTERREAEEATKASRRRLQALVDGIPQLVWRGEGRAERTWSSPQWSAFTGLSEAESRGRGWLAAVHPEDRAGALEAWVRAETADVLENKYRLRQAATGRYRWFQTRAAPVRGETGEVVEWLGTSTDVDELRGLEERQRLLLAELQHRVRNTLGVVRSIVRRTAATSASVEDYAAHLDGRLGAFARTQAMVTHDPAAGVDLAFLLVEELQAHAAREGEQVRLTAGSTVRFHAKAAETIGLAVHELTTNAVKHGALANPGGRIEVAWRVAADGGVPRLHLSWTESGGPAPPSKHRRGFGAELLERTLAYELKARTRLEFAPSGLRCTIELPLTPHVAVSVGDAA